MMSPSTVLILVVLVCFTGNSSGYLFNFTIKHVHLRMKSVGCDGNLQMMQNFSCSLKPTRDGAGLSTYKVFGFKNISDIHLLIKFYYKTGPRVHPFMINWSLDVCGFMARTVTMDPFLEALTKTLGKLAPTLYHPCPYWGDFGVEKINLAEVFERAYPQVIPTGSYKSVWRFHNSANETLITVWGVADITAIDVKKSYLM